jgi:hypothetical protein
LRIILKSFLTENQKYSESGIYFCPVSNNLNDFINNVSDLPFYDQSEIFGLHQNSLTLYEMHEGESFISTLLNRNIEWKRFDIYDDEAACLKIISETRNALPQNINVEHVHPNFKMVNL